MTGCAAMDSNPGGLRVNVLTWTLHVPAAHRLHYGDIEHDNQAGRCPDHPHAS
jgi:hypothetical protein